MSNHYYNYMTCFGCIMFLAIMLCVAKITQSDYEKCLEIQNKKVITLKVDSIYQSKSIQHLTEWHECSTQQQQKAFIRNDKRKRVLKHIAFQK